MQYGKVDGLDKPISRLVQGTMMIGSADLEYSFSLLDSVFEMGCNTFDSAHVYGGGDCERTLGQWINERGIREKVVILDKGAHHNADRKRVTPFDITADIHDSLARLKADYIDLYVLHRDDPSVPVGPIVEILNEHQKAGRIRAFGGSNWSHDRIQEANEYARQRGLIPFVASSPQFSLAVKVGDPWGGCVSISGPAHEAARRWYRESGMPVFAWSSLAGGFFSGRFNRNNVDQPWEDYGANVCIQSHADEDNFQRLDRATELGQKMGLTAAQIALAWVMHQGMNVFPLVGCRTAQEFKENAEALEVKLTPEQLAWLDLRD
jgi:aryl-alcohol dehydrogenase-like predicted oxidoreductase